MKTLLRFLCVALAGAFAAITPPQSMAGDVALGRHPPATMSTDRAHHGHEGGNRDNDRDDDNEGRDRARIVLEDVAVSAWDDGVSVGAQLQLQNVGKHKARDLRITRVEVQGGTYQGPGALPTSLGDLAAGEDVLYDAVLQVGAANGSTR